ncbi:RNase P modulator RnpM [Paenibacillus sp. GCM10027626]|uniref:RNase P modulator RnpM n=1 Tax=Paenibacillus sp. GCM10027626 TaxID=3273411 RepID=UPI0036388172
MRQRKIPLRKCVACQQMMPKKELIRVVKTPDDQILIDLTGKKAGRGAYLCGKVECFKLAKKTKALDRALKQPVGVEIYDQLEQDFIKVEETFLANKKQANDDE